MNKKPVYIIFAMLIGNLFTNIAFASVNHSFTNSIVIASCSGECQGATIGDGDDEKTNRP